MQIGGYGLLIPLIVFYTCVVNASWLCREASSVRTGHIITACGVGESQSLEQARVKSRESAIEEFKRVCGLSADCYEFDYAVIPKRTDCEFKEQTHTCYRAIDFEITSQKRKSISLNVRELEADLSQKNREISQIQLTIEKINQMRRTEQELSDKRQELTTLENNLSNKEAEALKLQDLTSHNTIESGGYRYFHQIFKSSIKVSFHYWASKLTSKSQNDIMWIAAYEKRPSSWLGLQLYGGFGRGHLSNQKNQESDIPAQGTPNSSEHFDGTVAYADVGIAALVYPGWRGIYLKSDLGQVNGRRESYDVTYNGSGAGHSQKSEDGFSSNYFGLHLGFDTRMDQKGWGAFFELGARKLKEQGNAGFMGAIGLNYGF